MLHLLSVLEYIIPVDKEVEQQVKDIVLDDIKKYYGTMKYLVLMGIIWLTQLRYI